MKTMLFDVSDLQTISSVAIEEKQKEIAVSYNDLVHIDRELVCQSYPDFTEEKYNHGMVVYDFEVFKYDWLVVLIDPVNETKNVIVNNRSALRRYFDVHSDCLWVGYNNKHYDDVILRGILLGLNPKEISDAIIVDGKNSYDILPRSASEIEFLSYDVSDVMHSLKVLEAFMGNDIRETEVPFDIQRPLTQKEIGQTMKYCIHDVEQTIEVFRRRINEYDAIESLIETFNLPENRINKTKQQICAEILECEKIEHDDEWDIIYVPTIRLEKYQYIKDWFIEASKKKDYKLQFETIVGGIPHQFGWGGVHGAPDKPIQVKDGKIYHLDVNSYYPSSILAYDLGSRNSKNPGRYRQIYEKRLALKKAGAKKAQAPLKIVLNGYYGLLRQKGGVAYDPRNGNSICVNGQLLLVDLIEKLEVMGDHIKLIQSNTDGIIVWIDELEKSEKWMLRICKEWSERTHMGLGCDRWDSIIQKDVNNYIGVITLQKDIDKLKNILNISPVNNYVFNVSNVTNEIKNIISDWCKETHNKVKYTENGFEVIPELERKGIYVKELSELDNDLPIVNKALVDYIVKGTPVETTINSCNSMLEFQKIVHVSSKYKYGWHNWKKLNEKTYRVYASNDLRDTYIGRCRDESSNPEKFANTPEHVFILNEDVHDIPMSVKLDKQWYIRLARKRLEDFGYKFTSSANLF